MFFNREVLGLWHKGLENFPKSSLIIDGSSLIIVFVVQIDDHNTPMIIDDSGFIVDSSSSG